MINETEIIRLESPDHFLGSSQNRYFGEGYRKTKHMISNLQIRDKLLIARLYIKWSSLWSQKKGLTISPHVGSLDFFLVSIQLVEYYIRIIDNIKNACIENMWISNFSCKAGNQSIECKEIPCSCNKISQEKEDDIITYQFKIKIDNASTRLTIQQKTCKKRNPKCLSSCNGLATIIINNINNSYKLGRSSYYNSAYKMQDRRIKNIEIHKDKQKIKAGLDLIDLDLKKEFKGVGRVYLPGITFCDLILVAGQLSQILLFKLEGITRDDANNLWLRSINCRYKKPIRNSALVEVSVISSEIFCIDKKHYRNVMLEFNFNEGDLIAECKAAYQIKNL